MPSVNSSKKIELIHILSLLNKSLYMNVRKEDVHKVVTDIHGPVDMDDPDYETAVNNTIDHVAERYPRLIEAAAMLQRNKLIDSRRYQALIGVFGFHQEIEPIPAFA